MTREPNLAVIESDLKHLSAIVHGLVKTSKDQQDIVQDLLLTARLMQQSQTATDSVINDELKPRLTELWDNRSAVKGGYVVLSMLCGLVVGGATVFGVVWAIQH